MHGWQIKKKKKKKKKKKSMQAGTAFAQFLNIFSLLNMTTKILEHLKKISQYSMATG